MHVNYCTFYVSIKDTDEPHYKMGKLIYTSHNIYDAYCTIVSIHDIISCAGVNF